MIMKRINTKGYDPNEDEEDIDPNYGKDPNDPDSGYDFSKDFRSWF